MRGITRRFGAKVAIHPFATTIGPCGVTGLLGPNGSGKSTLLRMLVGLVPPDAGEAEIDGVRLAGDGTAVRRRSTYMPGETALYGELTGRAHLRWLVAGRGREALPRAVAIAEELGLPLDRRVRGYSHGMKRQLLLAAVLAPAVRVRILDEPTEGLDPTKRRHVLDLLAEEARRGVTVLLSSHHLGEVARACGRTLFLLDGRLLEARDAEELQTRAHRLVRVAWTGAPERPVLERALAAAGAELLELDDRRAAVLLPEGAARPALRRFLEIEELPPLESLAYGTRSLQEVYRGLYGTEGV